MTAAEIAAYDAIRSDFANWLQEIGWPQNPISRGMAYDSLADHNLALVPLSLLAAETARADALEDTITALRSAVETEWYNGNMSEDTFARIDRIGAVDLPLLRDPEATR